MPRPSTVGSWTIPALPAVPSIPAPSRRSTTWGRYCRKRKNTEEAERLFRECLELSREVSGPEDPATIANSYNLGFVLNELGRVDEAEKRIRQSDSIVAAKSWAPSIPTHF